jgi:uncharacterized membrane protein YcaP (DUF421 family)
MIEKLRSYKVYDMAIFDFVLTFIGAILVASYFDKDVFLVFIILFIIGQIMHIAFGVETAFLKKIKC